MTALDLDIARYAANLDRLAAQVKRDITNLERIAAELKALPEMD